MNRLVPEPAFDGQLIDPRREPVSGRRCTIVDDRATVQHLDVRKRDWTLGPASIRLLLLSFDQAREVPAAGVVAREHERFLEPDLRNHDPFREQLRQAVFQLDVLDRDDVLAIDVDGDVVEAGRRRTRCPRGRRSSDRH